MAFKREEQLSGDALRNHLIASGYATSASWTPGPDPPDLVFTILRPKGVTESWGVEVTALTQYVEQSFRKGTRTITKTIERRVFEPAVHEVCEPMFTIFGKITTQRGIVSPHSVMVGAVESVAEQGGLGR